MFSQNVGDDLLGTEVANSSVQGCATRDSRSEELFIKLVNPLPAAEQLNIQLKGVKSLAPSATALTLRGDPDDSNSITAPRKIVPEETTVRDLKPDFIYSVPPYSIVVLKLKTKS
jgi:alpha-N-arabinofuranosidase